MNKDQLTIFEHDMPQPLPARMRPQTIDEIVGQQHLLGPGRVLRRIIEQDAVSSMIFWGPPGVGKTTLAGVIANHTKARFINFSAVTSGIKEIKEVMKEADESRRFGEKTIVFVDEIHRFNKAQQDAFLPFVEKGAIILIGATTENPSFEVNGALLSRCKVFVLKALTEEDIVTLLQRALDSPQGFGNQLVEVEEGVLPMIARFCSGDARTALSTLEMAVLNGEPAGTDKHPEAVRVTREVLEQCTSRKSLLYDKSGEEHYN
ncbi:MAG: AAA family ATPase, partial [Firmicutes bacterium]|nr:AAA family ATPase [Bacillota bacterium]